MKRNWTSAELIAFEDRIGELYLDNKLPFLFHLSGGNEDQLIEIFKDIKEGDYVISNHRSHYHALLHGIDPEVLTNMILEGRSMFVYDREKNFFCSAIIGGTPAIATGIAWALKKKGSNLEPVPSPQEHFRKKIQKSFICGPLNWSKNTI
jgi:pyruvate dehydrogenase E1 component alpha subunit